MAARRRSYRGRVPAILWPRPWLCRGLHGSIAGPLSAVSQRRAPSAPCARPCRAPVRRSPAPVPCRRHNARPCRRCSGCIAIQPCSFPLLPCHNTPGCIAIQPCLLHPFSCNTVNCIAIQFTAYPASPPIAIHFTPLNCIAIQFLPGQPLHNLAIQSAVLQYNFHSSQLPRLQYNFSLAISQYNLDSSKFPNFCTIFFFVFHYKYIFFHYFQQLEKSLKIIFFSFIFLDTQINF